MGRNFALQKNSIRIVADRYYTGSRLSVVANIPSVFPVLFDNFWPFGSVSSKLIRIQEASRPLRIRVRQNYAYLTTGVVYI